jgi:crotonobetainyl-CoA:carnitine CoA-transferase CaiB-like acyl-CoA transferase
LARALAGLRIVAFGAKPAAAIAAMLLAEHGADVTHVVRPGSPAFFPSAEAIWARGQHRVEFPLDAPEGLAAALDLVASADVMIETFRPGGTARFGLDAVTLCGQHPRLIYCSLPGFSPSDPERAALPGWEGLVQAATAATHPWFEGATGLEPPIFNALPIASAFAAFHALTAISAALLERERSGRGQAIEVSLYAAMYSALGSLGMRIHNVHSGPNQVINFVPLVRQYQCADGRWLQIHAFTRRAIRQFAMVAGVESWIAEGVLRLGPVISDPAVRATLQARLEALFLARTAQAWEDALSAAGVSAAVCRTASEWLRHPHALAGALAVDLATPDGSMRVPGSQLELPGEWTAPSASAGPSSPSGRPDTAAGAARGNTSASPLDGVRVLDLCIVLAGTTCGRTLAEYGAEVVKIDDPNRDGGVIFHNDVNRGKRSILLDLKTDAGKAVFWRLVARADVVVENFRAGVVERLGIDYESIRRRRPGIVYVSLNTYGYRGPWSGRPGWEQLAEAASGMQVRYGGDGRPLLQPYAVLDFGTGLSAAGGAMLALRQRQETGLGQHVTTSLIATAGTLQSALIDEAGADTTAAPATFGPSWFYRFYQSRDGWLFLAAEPAQAAVLGDAMGVDDLDTFSAAAAATKLAEAISVHSLADCLARLARAGVAALPARSINDVMRDPWAVGHGLSLQRSHGVLGPVDTIGPVPFLSRTPLVPGHPATYPGIDGREVLLEAGYEPAAVDALVSERVLVIPGRGSVAT